MERRGQDGKFHVLYKITNLLNDRFYIGIHSTRILNDGYFGSGKRIKCEIKKYGIQNFKKEFLAFFDDRKSLHLEERRIVNADLLKNELCLNLTIGGNGSFYVINSNPQLQFKASSASGKKTMENRKKDPLKMSLIAKKINAQRKINGTCSSFPSWEGRTHKQETKQKISISLQGKQKAEKNSQFGKMWIYNEETFESVRINKDDIIPNGWKKGRKMKRVL